MPKKFDKKAQSAPTRTKRTREQQVRETRNALMKAALRVVARHGYARASVSRITEAAGVAQGTFYSYFDTHQQLLDELLPSEGVLLLNALGREAHGSGDYFEHERRTFLAFFKYLRRNPYFLRVLNEAEIAAPTSHAQHMSNIEDRYLAALHRAQKNHEIREQNDKSFRVIAEVLSGARGHIAYGLSEIARGSQSKNPPDWTVDTFIKFIRSGLGSKTEKLKASSATKPAGKKISPKPPEAGDTRALLLNAAARLVYEHGYEATTVASITKAANVAVGTFYAYFPSRQEILDEALIHVREQMLAYVRAGTRGSKSFLEMEQRGFKAFFEYLATSPWFIRVETEAAVWSPESYARHFRDLLERYLKAMRRSKAAGELKDYEDHELPILAFIFMAARHYLSTRYVLAKGGHARLPSYAIDTYLDFVRYGLTPR